MNHFYLLDGVGGAFLLVVFGAGVLFLFLAVLIEAFVLHKMHFTDTFGRAMLFSFVANLVSTVAGIFLSNVDTELFRLTNIKGFAILFIITVILELAVLYLMNKQSPVKRTLLICVLMNLATYALAAIFIILIYNG